MWFQMRAASQLHDKWTKDERQNCTGQMYLIFLKILPILYLIALCKTAPGGVHNTKISETVQQL